MSYSALVGKYYYHERLDIKVPLTSIFLLNKQKLQSFLAVYRQNFCIQVQTEISVPTTVFQEVAIKIRSALTASYYLLSINVNFPFCASQLARYSLPQNAVVGQQNGKKCKVQAAVKHCRFIVLCFWRLPLHNLFFMMLNAPFTYLKMWR